MCNRCLAAVPLAVPIPSGSLKQRAAGAFALRLAFLCSVVPELDINTFASVHRLLRQELPVPCGGRLLPWAFPGTGSPGALP